MVEQIPVSCFIRFLFSTVHIPAYQSRVKQFPGLAKYGLPYSCTADSDLAEYGLARYSLPHKGMN